MLDIRAVLSPHVSGASRFARGRMPQELHQEFRRKKRQRSYNASPRPGCRQRVAGFRLSKVGQEESAVPTCLAKRGCVRGPSAILNWMGFYFFRTLFSLDLQRAISTRAMTVVGQGFNRA